MVGAEHRQGSIFALWSWKGKDGHKDGVAQRPSLSINKMIGHMHAEPHPHLMEQSWRLMEKTKEREKAREIGGFVC